MSNSAALAAEQSVQNATRVNKRLDGAGMLISCACVLHCLAVPILLTFMPALALTFFFQEWGHKLLVVIAYFVAIPAILQGRKSHSNRTPGLVMLLGLALMTGAFFAEDIPWAEQVMTSLGALITAGGHLWNFRLAKAGHAAS